MHNLKVIYMIVLKRMLILDVCLGNFIMITKNILCLILSNILILNTCFIFASF